jgi:hypothetical protein
MGSTSALVLEWGVPIEGREHKAIEEFMTSLAWWGELKQKGKIADFRVYGTNTGDFERVGLAILEGTDAQINDLRASEEFRVRINHVLLIGKNIKITVCEMGDIMATRLQRYGKSVKEKLG